MIIFDINSIIEPPLTKDLSDLELKEIIETPSNIKQYPCHSQAVERHAILITEASSRMYGGEERDEYVRNKLESRQLISNSNPKRIGSFNNLYCRIYIRMNIDIYACIIYLA